MTTRVQSCSRSLPRSPASPVLARRFLRDALPGLPEEVVQLAQLMLSELVTNVLMHARSAMELQIEVATEAFRVTVEDASARLPQTAVDGVTGGLGLEIVDSLSSTWGWDRTPFGKRVWFELRWPVGPDPGVVAPR